MLSEGLLWQHDTHITAQYPPPHVVAFIRENLVAAAVSEIRTHDAQIKAMCDHPFQQHLCPSTAKVKIAVHLDILIERIRNRMNQLDIITKAVETAFLSRRSSIRRTCSIRIPILTLWFPNLLQSYRNTHRKRIQPAPKLFAGECGELRRLSVVSWEIQLVICDNASGGMQILSNLLKILPEIIPFFCDWADQCDVRKLTHHTLSRRNRKRHQFLKMKRLMTLHTVIPENIFLGDDVALEDHSVWKDLENGLPLTQYYFYSDTHKVYIL